MPPQASITVAVSAASCAYQRKAMPASSACAAACLVGQARQNKTMPLLHLCYCTHVFNSRITALLYQWHCQNEDNTQHQQAFCRHASLLEPVYSVAIAMAAAAAAAISVPPRIRKRRIAIIAAAATIELMINTATTPPPIPPIPVRRAVLHRWRQRRRRWV